METSQGCVQGIGSSAWIRPLISAEGNQEDFRRKPDARSATGGACARTSAAESELKALASVLTCCSAQPHCFKVPANRFPSPTAVADAANDGGRGKRSTGRDPGRLGCTRSCEGMVEQKKLKTWDFDGERQPMSTTTKDGFVGDIGRWQQRLGIAVESDGGGGSGEPTGGAARGSPCGPPSATVTTAKDLMDDSVLKEAFAARGRHKKSPVLAREVRGTSAHACRLSSSPV